MDNHVVVVGGTGRTGRLVVQRLLERGEQVRVVGRSIERARRRLPPAAQFHRADVREPAGLEVPLRGCSALVYCVEPGTDDAGYDRPEATMHLGVGNVLAAATAGGGRPHLVLVSQVHATHRVHPLNAFGRLLEWRFAGEELVRSCGLPYTVIRPGWLSEARAGGEGVRLEQGDQGAGHVARGDLAEACVQALYSPSACAVTFEIFNRPGGTPPWDQAFARLRLDPVTVS
jgi:uncharacterized protein YbjT (DUF2867 family)